MTCKYCGVDITFSPRRLEKPINGSHDAWVDDMDDPNCPDNLTALSAMVMLSGLHEPLTTQPQGEA